jgi:hypothetical protein
MGTAPFDAGNSTPESTEAKRESFGKAARKELEEK